MKETLRLFNGIIIPDLSLTNNHDVSYEDYCKETIKAGYIVDRNLYNLIGFTQLIILDEYLKEMSANYDQWNNGFYKSWEKVNSVSDDERLFDQILHYFTTYGPLADSPFMYIPEGSFELPELSTHPIYYVKLLTRDQVISKILDLLKSGVALKSETQNYLLKLWEQLSIPMDNTSGIRNKEFKIRLYNLMNFVPGNPEEFLRYVLWSRFQIDLVIKSPSVIENIKDEVENDMSIEDLFDSYASAYGLEGLASIFYRYKPIFLAFRSNVLVKPTINKIRKMAPKCHKPMREDFLNTITNKIKKGIVIDEKELETAIGKANNFRKIRLMYALKGLRADSDDRVYKIRNGKSWATKIKSTDFSKKGYLKVAKALYASLVDSLAVKVKDKTFYIPGNINFALPATEKQFIGNYPSGTYVEAKEHIAFGIHWTNPQQSQEVDLDLSCISMAGDKTGWDSYYGDGSVLFSGDITDAPKPHGASEFFLFKKAKPGVYIIMVNYYNSYEDENEEIPFEVIVGEGSTKAKFLLNPNKILAKTGSTVGKRQKTIGVVKVTKTSTKIYFNEMSSNAFRSSRETEVTKIQRAYLLNSLDMAIDFKKILLDAGAVESEEPNDADFDFANLDKTVMLELFY